MDAAPGGGGALRRIWSTFARLHADHPRRFLLLAVLLTVAAALAWTRFRFSADLTDLLPSDSEAARAFRTFRDAFGQSDQLVVAAIAEQDVDASAWTARLRERLERRDEIRAVSSGPLESLTQFAEHVLPAAGFAYLQPDEAARLHDTLTDEGLARAFARDVQLLAQSPGLETSELVRRDPLFLRELLAGREGGASGGAIGAGGLGSGGDDAAFAVLVIAGHRPAQDLDESRRLVAAVEAEIAALGVPGGLRLLRTGGYAIAVEDSARVRHDLTSSTGSSVVLVLTLFFLGFRGLWPLLFAGLPLLLGIAWAYGLFLALRGGITMLTAVGPAMLVGLGDFGVHLYAELKQARAEGMPRELARRAMLERTAPRLALAALTSASCFLAFGLTGFRGLADLGLLAGIGLLCCLVAFLILFPLLVARHDPPRGRAPLSYVTDAVAAAPLRWPRLALAIAAAVTLAAGGVLASRGIPSFTTDARLLHAKSSPAFDALEEIGRRVPRPLVPWVVVAEGADPVELADRFARLEARLVPLRASGELLAFELPTRVLPPPSVQQATFARLRDLDPAATAAAFRREAEEAGFDPDAFPVLERSLRANLERAALRHLAGRPERGGRADVEVHADRGPVVDDRPGGDPELHQLPGQLRLPVGRADRLSCD
jgi:predicted RND superfamily exporter protein